MHKLFVIGDSISQQVGPYLQEMVSSCYTLERKQSGQVDDGMHANGGDSSHVLNYLRWVEQSDLPRPDLLLVNCGLHDIKVDVETGNIQVPLEQYGQNLHDIVGVARRVADRMVWVTTTPVDDTQHNSRSDRFHRFARDHARYAEAAAGVMDEHDVPVIDLCRFTASLPGNPYCDHVHFTDEVRRLQAAHIAGFVLAVEQADRF